MKKVIFLSICFFSSSVYSAPWQVTKPSLTTDYYVLDSKRIPMNSSGSKNAVILRPTPVNSSYSIPVSGTQSINQSIVIEAIDRSSTLKGRFLWSDFQIRQGLKNFVKFTKVTPQSLVISSIIGFALDQGYDWVVGDDGSILNNSSDVDYLDSVDESYFCWNVTVGTSQGCYSNPVSACRSGASYSSDYEFITNVIPTARSDGLLNCRVEISKNPWLISVPNLSSKNNGVCPVGYSQSGLGCYVDSAVGQPVDSSEIDSVIDNMVASDLDVSSFDELMKSSTLPNPESFLIDSITPSSLQSSPVITDKTDITTGDLISEQVQDTYDFSFDNVDNNAVITGSVITNNQTYKNGNLVSSSTTTDVGSSVSGDTNSNNELNIDWMCGISGTPDCSVSVNDSGFEDIEPLENSQQFIDDYVDSVLDDLPDCSSGDCTNNNPWGFSMDIFMPDFSSLVGACQNPDLSLFGVSVDVDICDLASKVKPLLNFLVYFMIVFNFRRLFLSIPKKV